MVRDRNDKGPNETEGNQTHPTAKACLLGAANGAVASDKKPIHQEGVQLGIIVGAIFGACLLTAVAVYCFAPRRGTKATALRPPDAESLEMGDWTVAPFLPGPQSSEPPPPAYSVVGGGASTGIHARCTSHDARLRGDGSE